MIFAAKVIETEGLAQPIYGGGDITVAQRRHDCGCELGGAHRKFRFALQRAGSRTQVVL